MSLVDMLPEQFAISAESKAFVNLTNDAALAFKIRLQGMERTLGRVSHSVVTKRDSPSFSSSGAGNPLVRGDLHPRRVLLTKVEG